MKRTTLYSVERLVFSAKCLLACLFALPMMTVDAQTVGDAFYIYRNDGQFNAFFRDEVDSIAYSYYDADSVYYNDIVTQVIYTPDSIYRIPLAAIDSVGFVQPETILKPNVVLMEKAGLSDYLKSVDGMTLFFYPSIPNSLRPKIGDVLFSTDFNNPLFEEGFVGKVLSTKMTADDFQVVCDSVYDIMDIFEQLISIEKVRDESAANSKARKVNGEWISSRNTVNFNLGYTHPLSDGEVSVSGSVDGTYIATVAYNITLKEQFINLKIHHDWQYGAHLNFKSSKGFGTLKGNVNSLPAFRFPAVAPVFKFQIGGCPFVKGEGNIELDFSLNSPVHSYLAEVTYRNGHFSGSNKKQPVQGNNYPSFDTAFSLNGSVQTGYMVDFWLGTINAIGSYLRTGLDFYLGPKMTGDFTMKAGTTTPVNYYSMFKDSKFGLSLLTVDYEFFGEAAFAGHQFPKAMFCNGSFQSPLYHEWYILPEFSDLTVKQDVKNLSATISTTPTRDILIPLSVGLGLYNKSGNLLDKKYQGSNYKRENEGYTIQQTFSSLERNTEYTARPMIKILGGEVPALPTKDFKLADTSCPDSNHPHMIDLGIGTKWACCNVGAHSPEEYGGYYAWGEVSEKSVYNEVTYKYATGVDTDGDGWYDCDWSYQSLGSDISGTGYDVAHVQWGGSWCMPTVDEIKALVNNCSSVWTTENGVYGRRFTGPNGGSIFLPAAGYRWYGGLYGAGENGDYWSSTQFPDSSYNAYVLRFSSGGAYWYDYSYRVRGHSVRPVVRN